MWKQPSMLVAPERIDSKKVSVFLAGSIVERDWQSEVAEVFNKLNLLSVNPRREDWNALGNSENDPEFVKQVLWEIGYLTSSDFVFMYFAPESEAPISLLELGISIFRNFDKSIMVVCPDGFYRAANVRLTCDYYGIEHISTEDPVAAASIFCEKFRKRIQNKWSNKR